MVGCDGMVDMLPVIAPAWKREGSLCTMEPGPPGPIAEPGMPPSDCARPSGAMAGCDIVVSDWMLTGLPVESTTPASASSFIHIS